MRDFLFNLSVLAAFGIAFYWLFPDITRGILQLYNGLGILPIFVLMVIVAGLAQAEAPAQVGKERRLNVGRLKVGTLVPDGRGLDGG